MFKRDEPPDNNADFAVVNSNVNFQSFKYKAALVGKAVDVADKKMFVKSTKIIIPLKYLSNLWRSLEMPLINRISHLE